MFRFHLLYFLISLFLLGLEIFIAARLHDAIIRPYGGDYLVVILLYCIVRSALDFPILPTAAAVLIFSYLVEISQYYHLADHLGLGAHSLARILLGSYFTWTDILAYTLGILTVLGIERIIRGNKYGKFFCP
jgi:hypothetical protein